MVVKISNIFGVLEIPDIFWGEGQMLGPSLRMLKKLEYPPPPRASSSQASNNRGTVKPV